MPSRSVPARVRYGLIAGGYLFLADDLWSLKPSADQPNIIAGRGIRNRAEAFHLSDRSNLQIEATAEIYISYDFQLPQASGEQPRIDANLAVLHAKADRAASKTAAGNLPKAAVRQVQRRI